MDFVDAVVDREAMKTDRSIYPFGQCPRYADAEVDLCQSNAIVRHLGRKHGLTGASLAEQAAVDELIEAVEAIKGKYLALIYQDGLSDEAKAKYWTAHCDASTVAARNGGAHFTFVSDFVARGPGVFAVGGTLTVADVMLFDIIDMHLRIFPEDFPAAFPTMAALHAAVAAVPGVAAYLASGRRAEQQNGVALG